MATKPSKPYTVVELSNDYRQALQDKNVQATQRLAKEYDKLRTSVQKDLRNVNRDIRAATNAGEELSTKMITQRDTYRRLMIGLDSKLAEIGDLAEKFTNDGARTAVRNAINFVADTGRLAEWQNSKYIAEHFRRVDFEAVNNMIANTRYGPLKSLLEKRVGEKSGEVSDLILDGLMRGKSPTVVTAAVHGILDADHAKLAGVIQTETYRAYRETTHQALRACDDVTQWQWFSICQRNTCAFCWAQHGKVFPDTERMATHPSCRCTQLPVIDGDTTIPGGLGSDQFNKLPGATQENILGRGAYKAFKDGKFTIDDVVGETKNHPTWGPSAGRKSLRDIIGLDEAQKYYAGGYRGRRRPGDPIQVTPLEQQLRDKAAIEQGHLSKAATQETELSWDTPSPATSTTSESLSWYSDKPAANTTTRRDSTPQIVVDDAFRKQVAENIRLSKIPRVQVDIVDNDTLNTWGARGTDMKAIRDGYDGQALHDLILKVQKDIAEGVESDLDTNAVRRLVTRVFADNIHREDIYNFRYNVNVVRSGDDIVINIDLLDDHGIFGTIIRHVGVTKDDAIVQNYVFTLDRKYQNRGIATDVYYNLENMFYVNGIDKISVYANIDIGGYTWSRFGFGWGQGVGQMKLLTILNDVERYAKTTAEKKLVEEYKVRVLNTAMSNWPTPFEISNVGWKEGSKMWPGKKAMLGSDWFGVKKLIPPDA